MRIFQKIKNIGHFVVAVLANIVFRFPSKELQVIGVTGTDGKTTTSNLIFHILKTNGKKVSIISTISAVIGETESDTGFHVTTPSSFSVQKYIRQAVDYGSKYFVLETTSHALDQYRVFGVRFDVSVITNITQEHLHYHGTYEHYVSSKSKLIHWSNKTFVNKDDQSYSYILKHIGNKKIETYGFNNDADNIIDISKKINIPLAKFNQYNYLAAFLICRELGIAEEDIYPSMKTYKLPPGRLEIVYRGDFIVIVDFAHTPHAVQEALSSIRDGSFMSLGQLLLEMTVNEPQWGAKVQPMQIWSFSQRKIIAQRIHMTLLLRLLKDSRSMGLRK